MDVADLDRLLIQLGELDGSDLHIKAGAPPRMRIAGALRTVEGEADFTAPETLQISEAIMTEPVRETFRAKHEADFAYSIPGVGRFRINAYYQRSSAALAIRRVRGSAATAEELGLPPVVTQRDQETVAAALSAAETGHLVFSTLHTINSTETVNRIVDFFPPHQQSQIRLSLAGSLKGIVCQRLIPTIDGDSRVPALEVLVINGRIQQAIIDPLLTGDIESIVADGAYYGMMTFDQSLAGLMAAGKISLAEAMATASNPHDLKVMLERQGILQTGSFAAQLGCCLLYTSPSPRDRQK